MSRTFFEIAFIKGNAQWISVNVKWFFILNISIQLTFFIAGIKHLLFFLSFFLFCYNILMYKEKEREEKGIVI